MKHTTFGEFLKYAGTAEDYCYGIYLELTHACNFNCGHCYLPKRDNGKSALTLPEYEKAAEDLQKAGTFHVSLTGGEPLMHPAFTQIYTTFKTKGFFVSVMTNGYLLTEAHFRLFEELPPRSVEISLYGLDKDVFRQSTRTQGDPMVVVENARRIKSMGIDLKLKTVMTRINKHEIVQCRQFADELDADYRYDVSIHPDVHGCRTPCASMAGIEEIKKTDRQNIPYLLKGPVKIRERNFKNTGRKRFVCGMGHNGIVVDPEGNVHPCLIYRDNKWNIKKDLFRNIMHEGFPHVLKLTRRFSIPCDECKMADECSFCGATLLMYGDDISAIKDYCAITKNRIAVLKEHAYEISKT